MYVILWSLGMCKRSTVLGNSTVTRTGVLCLLFVYFIHVHMCFFGSLGFLSLHHDMTTDSPVYLTKKWNSKNPSSVTCLLSVRDIIY